LTPQVEVQPLDKAFTDRVSNEGSAQVVSKGASTTFTVTVQGFHNGGQYHWQARLVDAARNSSPWTPFADPTKASFKVDTVAPTTPKISSRTNPKWGGWYRSRNASFAWKATDSESGIAGYSFVIGRKEHAARPPMTQSTSFEYRDISDGRWIFHVWARDMAGNWSAVGQYKINISTRAPVARFAGLSSHHFNPFTQKSLTWYFKLNRPAKVSLALTRSGLKGSLFSRDLGTLKSGGHSFIWRGRVHNKRAPRGWYWIRVTTVDTLGNKATFAFGGVAVDPFKPKLPFVWEKGRHIVVSLSKQALYAYNGNKLVMTTLVTTGNPALPTPTGHFSIFAKFHPFEFISPWPPGSPYWYAPSWTSWTMEFQDQGYFIHDAPWRSVYGPGSNGPGTPGTNYGGTHGCVNVPYNPAKFLYHWAPIGTAVDIVN
jgi:hypothetical protein